MRNNPLIITVSISAWCLLLIPPAFGVNAQTLIGHHETAQASPYFFPLVFIGLALIACVAMARSKKQ